jgi:hypothetical protein
VRIRVPDCVIGLRIYAGVRLRERWVRIRSGCIYTHPGAYTRVGAFTRAVGVSGVYTHPLAYTQDSARKQEAMDYRGAERLYLPRSHAMNPRSCNERMTSDEITFANCMQTGETHSYT